MKRTALIAGVVAAIMLIPIGFFFPEQIGKISAIGAAFILVCIFVYIVFRRNE